MPRRKSKLKTVQIKKITARHIIKITKSTTEIFKKEIAQYLDNNGFLSWSSKEKKYFLLGTNSPKKGLVQCPQCKVGELMVIRSRTTKKRFMGCSNFYDGCKASSPLLQKAKMRATKKPCEICKWPMIIFVIQEIKNGLINVQILIAKVELLNLQSSVSVCSSVF